MENRNNKGFTLAELLIVVAIIAVLTAVAIPVFSTQLEKAKEATDLANIRAAYAEINTKYIETGSTEGLTQNVAVTQADPSKWVTDSPKVGNIDMSSKTAAKAEGLAYILTGSVDANGAFSISISVAVPSGS